MFCLTLVQGLGRRVPPMANTLLNYCFLSYGDVKTDTGGYHIGQILIGLERVYGERQVYLVLDSDQQS